MPVYKTHNSIKDILELLNSRLYNKGYSFQVALVESNYVYVQASFDFAYYVNVHITFNNVKFTNLKENETWPDAWHANQLLLFEEIEVALILDLYSIELMENEPNCYAFVFNINGKNYDSKGIVIATEIEIRWEHPYYD